MEKDIKFETLCLHADGNHKDEWGTITAPICQASTFVHKQFGVPDTYTYSRLRNPTRTHAEQTVAALEGGVGAFAYSSGMAAISAALKLISPPAHVIASEDLYGGSMHLFRAELEPLGYSFDFIDTGDLSRVRSCMRGDTAAIYVETPSNPLMMVSDIAALATLAHEHGALLIVDNTFLTPYFQRPISLGADVVIHSGTKYLGGHNDVLAGFVVAAKQEYLDALFPYYKTAGAALAPFDCFLVERGIKTLAIRMERIAQNASRIATYLRAHKAVKKVYYAGFADHPGYAVSKRQTTGFGGMISFEADSRETAERILKGCRIIQYAESLGGVESLITYPMTQTHADIPATEREARGINDRFLRLSVGIEDADDLIADLEQAMKA